jgi:guanylate kinase
MGEADNFDYTVVNDDVPRAVEELEKVIDAALTGKLSPT